MLRYRRHDLGAPKSFARNVNSSKLKLKKHSSQLDSFGVLSDDDYESGDENDIFKDYDGIYAREGDEVGDIRDR